MSIYVKDETIKRALRYGAATLFTLCLIGNFFVARSMPRNADMVQNYNELKDIWAGNFLLHGWWLATDNFYLSDLPPYVLGRLLMGPTTALLYLVPYAVFVLFLVACILLVRGPAKTDMECNAGMVAVLVLLGFPFEPVQELLLQSSVHGAVITFSLYGILIGQRFLRAPAPGLQWLVPFIVIVIIVSASDPQVIAYFNLPLVLLVILRTWLYGKFRLPEWALAGVTFLATGFGVDVPSIIMHNGGFHLAQNYSMNFVPTVMDLWGNIRELARTLELSFDARAVVLGKLPFHGLVAQTRLLTCFAVILLCIRTIWRAPRMPQNGLGQWLVLGAICLAGADVVSEVFTQLGTDGGPGLPYDAVRYMVPAYVYISIAAVVEGQALALLIKPRPLRGILVAAVLVGSMFVVEAALDFAAVARKPVGIQSMPQSAAAKWLLAHGFTYGVGDYWMTQVVSAASQNKVAAEPVILTGATLSPFRWASDMSGLDAHQPPQFAIFAPMNQFGVTITTLTAAYGKPVSIERLGELTIVIFDQPKP